MKTKTNPITLTLALMSPLTALAKIFVSHTTVYQHEISPGWSPIILFVQRLL